MYNSFTVGSSPASCGPIEIPDLSPTMKTNGTSAGIFKQSIGARNRAGRVLPYRTARLHKLVKLIPCNRFLGSVKVRKIRAQDYQSGF
jgi:hypothetical protein